MIFSLAQSAATAISLISGGATTSAPDAAAGNPVEIILFFLFAAMVVGSALIVALARSIVRAATALLFTLAGMAGFYFLLHAEFLAAVQLVVYVGGTLILFIFGVMLTSKSPQVRYEPSFMEVVWALSVGVLITVPLVILAATVAWPMGVNPTTTEGYDVRALGRALIDPEGFLAPFELVSVVLLAVMIGAAYLAKVRQKSRGQN